MPFLDLPYAPRPDTAEEIIALLALQDPRPLYQKADALTRKHHGLDIQIRALLEFSNYCRRDCTYCGLRVSNRESARYRLEPAEILAVAQEAASCGYQTLVLQSGEDLWYDTKILGQIIRSIKQTTDMKVTLSVGERSQADYAHFKAQGADRYLLKHETADPRLYTSLHPGASQQNRLECLRVLKRLGYETGGGFMIGLPGQSLSIIAQDLLLLDHLEVDMAGIGPFIAHPHTPLAGAKAGDTELTKRAVAVLRLLRPLANLPATTSLGVRSEAHKRQIFSCGANVIMQKVTPKKVARHYQIYPANLPVADMGEQRRSLERWIVSLGKKPR